MPKGIDLFIRRCRDAVLGRTVHKLGPSSYMYSALRHGVYGVMLARSFIMYCDIK